MSRASRTETERRLRIMAKNWVDMKAGIYDWPPGSRKKDRNGLPRIDKGELLRSAGYSDKYAGRGKALFEDDYFKKEVALEEARRAEVFARIADNDKVDVLATGMAMLDELHTRIINDPSCFTTEQLAKYAPAVVRIGLEIKAKKESGNKQPQITNKGIIAQNLLVMSEEERERLLEKQEERQRQIRAMVDAANEREAIVDVEPAD